MTLATRTSAGRLPGIAVLFVVCLAVPVFFHLGSLRLSPYRLVLLVMLMPCLLRWLSGGMGRILVPDLLVLGIAAWSALSFLVVHRGEGIEAAGIVFIETLTPYLLARWAVRDLETFRHLVRLLVMIVLVLMPFALVETLTARNVILEVARLGLPAFPDVEKPARWGLDRVQGPFEHPILFGVFCGTAVALGYYVLSPARRILRTGLTGIVAALSLSSGPLSALVAQGLLMAWDLLFRAQRNRWLAFGILAAIAYVVVDLISNRSPAEVFISYAAFNPQTAFSRLLIWEWTWVNTWQHPLFGLGNNDWQRMWFMTASVDMFWMHRTMSHGLPVGLLNQFAFFWVVISLARKRDLAPEIAACRMGLIVCLAGLYIAGMTVHFWNATFVWLMFLLGAGAWMARPDPGLRVQEPIRVSAAQPATPAGLLA